MTFTTFIIAASMFSGDGHVGLDVECRAVSGPDNRPLRAGHQHTVAEKWDCRRLAANLVGDPHAPSLPSSRYAQKDIVAFATAF